MVALQNRRCRLGCRSLKALSCCRGSCCVAVRARLFVLVLEGIICSVCSSTINTECNLHKAAMVGGITRDASVARRPCSPQDAVAYLRDTLQGAPEDDAAVAALQYCEAQLGRLTTGPPAAGRPSY